MLAPAYRCWRAHVDAGARIAGDCWSMLAPDIWSMLASLTVPAAGPTATWPWDAFSGGTPCAVSRTAGATVPPIVVTKDPLAWTGDREARTNRVLPSVRKGWTCRATLFVPFCARSFFFEIIQQFGASTVARNHAVAG